MENIFGVNSDGMDTEERVRIGTGTGADMIKSRTSFMSRNASGYPSKRFGKEQAVEPGQQGDKPTDLIREDEMDLEKLYDVEDGAKLSSVSGMAPRSSKRG